MLISLVDAYLSPLHCEKDGFDPIVSSQFDTCLVYYRLYSADRYAEELGNLTVVKVFAMWANQQENISFLIG